MIGCTIGRRLAPAALLALSVAATPVARAEADGPTVDAVDVVAADGGFDIVLRGTGRLGDERVHTRPGLLRVWLGGFDDAVRLDARGDGVRVGRVEVRPGVDQSVLVSVAIGQRATLDPSAVTITRSDGATRIALPGPALPPLPAEPPAAAPAPEPVPASRPAPAVEDDTAPTEDAAARRDPPATEQARTPPAATPVQPHSQGDAEAPPRDDGKEASDGGASSATPFPWELEDAAEDDADESLALGTADAGTATGTLVVVTLLLGLVYLGVRLLQNRNLAFPGTDPAITLVATRRLGPKHQLVVVRAMGRDHLLSVQGNATKRLASMRSPDPETFEASFDVPDLPIDEPTSGVVVAPGPETPPEPMPEAPSDTDAGAGDVARQAVSGLRYAVAPRPPIRSARPPIRRSSSAPRPDASDLESRFGSSLFDYAVAAQRRTEAADRSDDEPSDSLESIAGLLKLRARRRSAS